MQPIEVECPHCLARAGKRCKTATGSWTYPHASRIGVAVTSTFDQAAKRLVEIDLDEGVEPASGDCSECGAPAGGQHAPYCAYNPEPMESVVVDGADHPPYRLEGWAVEDVPRPKTKGPFAGRSKLPHIVRVKTWVWCDKHEGFHEAANIGKHDGVNCGRLFWRRAYVETDDKKETF